MKWNDSNELREHALRELQVAVEENKPKVEFLIQERFSGDVNGIRRIADNLEIKAITELLREKFSEYEIKSRVETKGELNAVLSFRDAPCSLFYPLVWTLTLQKK